MKHESPMLLALHSLVRAILTQHSVEHGYLIICKSLFHPYVIKSSESGAKSTHIDLQKICDHIYFLDEKELSYTSCYSACIVAQILAMTHGIAAEIVIGVKKQDKKIVGHAWLEYASNSRISIANPGHIDPCGFTEIKRLAPETSIQTWMKQRAILDHAATALP